MGFVSGGLGLVALGVGGFFGVQAYQKNQDSLAQCRKGDPNSCSAEGTALRDDARSAGTRATIAMIAGGVLLGTGITLLVVAPASRETQSAGPRLRQVSVGPGVLQLTGEL